MTFYYDKETDELVGNNMFYEYGYGTVAEVRGDSLIIDVETIMEDGRGIDKLYEIRNAANKAIDAHEDIEEE